MDDFITKDNLSRVIADLERKMKKIESCSRKGHPGERVLALYVKRAWCHCDICGIGYLRPLKTEESEKWYKLTNTPMTI